jgi:hypothetical protein
VPAPQNGFGTAAMVLGICSIVLSCLYGVLGILAIIFGILGRKRVRRGEATNPGQALAGIICGSIGVTMSAALVILSVAFVGYDDDNGRHDSEQVGDNPFSTSLFLDAGTR